MDKFLKQETFPNSSYSWLHNVRFDTEHFSPSLAGHADAYRMLNLPDHMLSEVCEIEWLDSDFSEPNLIVRSRGRDNEIAKIARKQILEKWESRKEFDAYLASIAEDYISSLKDDKNYNASNIITACRYWPKVRRKFFIKQLSRAKLNILELIESKNIDINGITNNINVRLLGEQTVRQMLLNLEVTKKSFKKLWTSTTNTIKALICVNFLMNGFSNETTILHIRKILENLLDPTLPLTIQDIAVLNGVLNITRDVNTSIKLQKLIAKKIDKNIFLSDLANQEKFGTYFKYIINNCLLYMEVDQFIKLITERVIDFDTLTTCHVYAVANIDNNNELEPCAIYDEEEEYGEEEEYEEDEGYIEENHTEAELENLATRAVSSKTLCSECYPEYLVTKINNTQVVEDKYCIKSINLEDFYNIIRQIIKKLNFSNSEFITFIRQLEYLDLAHNFMYELYADMSDDLFLEAVKKCNLGCKIDEKRLEKIIKQYPLDVDIVSKIHLYSDRLAKSILTKLKDNDALITYLARVNPCVLSRYNL